MEKIRFLDQEIFGNPISAYIICIGFLFSGFILKRYGARFMSQASFRIIRGFSKNKFSEEFVELLKSPFEQLLALIILFLAFDHLNFPASWHLVPVSKIGLRWAISTTYQILVFVVITKILLRATDFFSYVLQNRDDAPISRELANFLKELLKVLLVIICAFTALRFIFDVNITALVASLGIGGLAVALAAQDTLTNLLASFTIYLDKPFKVGDLIETGEIKGTVEYVGFRTTRLRTLDKSLLTVPNKKMIDSALNNITLSEMRRVRIVLNLTYKSQTEQILSIVGDLKKVIGEHPDTNDDYVVHFTDISSSSLNILVLYFVNGNEYEKMLTVKEEINIKIMKIVEQHGCEFAFPTQTVYLQK